MFKKALNASDGEFRRTSNVHALASLHRESINSLICVFYECFLCILCVTVPPLRFLRLGTTPGVRQIFLPAEDEAVSDAISPPGGFRIFGETSASFYVRKGKYNLQCNSVQDERLRSIVSQTVVLANLYSS